MATHASDCGPRDTTRRKAGLITLNVAAVFITLAAMVVAPTGTRMVVLVWPWSEPGRIMEIVTQAGGSLVNGGAAGWVVVAEGDGGDFAGRLMAAGAMLVLDGRLAEACLGLGI